MKKFLTARWEDLIMANYALEPSLLKGRVPTGTKLDLFDGKCFVSLVAFRFADTKVLGIPVPFHINFEEVNLRFYVTRETEGELRRGVVFVKEIVPRVMITLVARALYGEPYETWKMMCVPGENNHTYTWSDRLINNRLHVETAESLGVPQEASLEEFITEHYWGYTRRGANRTDEYRVEHPKWKLLNINYAELEIDFGKTYGPEFDFLSDKEPDSILFAKGSEISVYKGESITNG